LDLDRQEQQQEQRKKQIPFGNDKQKGTDKGNNSKNDLYVDTA